MAKKIKYNRRFHGKPFMVYILIANFGNPIWMLWDCYKTRNEALIGESDVAIYGYDTQLRERVR